MSKKPIIGLAPNGNIIRSAGSDMDKSWSGHSTFRPLRNAEGDDEKLANDYPKSRPTDDRQWEKAGWVLVHDAEDDFLNGHTIVWWYKDGALFAVYDFAGDADVWKYKKPVRSEREAMSIAQAHDEDWFEMQQGPRGWTMARSANEDDMEKKALADVWFPKRTPLEHTWFDKAAEEDPEKVSGAPSAEGLFFKNPKHYETREFAESEANTNDQEVAKEHADEAGVSTSDELKKTKDAPPTPSDIKDEAGGAEFGTLNRIVVDTDHETKGNLPEGWETSPKMDEVPTKQAGMPDPRYLAKGILKVDPNPKFAGGDVCPFCGTDNVSYMTGRDEGLEIRGSHAYHSLQCYNCHSQWEEHFSLKLKKMDVRKYPSKVLMSKPVDASPVGRTKIWSVGKAANETSSDQDSSLLDVWGIIGEDK